MPISYSQIPADLKIPLYWVEVDPSMAGLPVLHQPALLVGVMNNTGTATPDVAIAIGSQAQADYAFGAGSELSRMFKAYFANNFSNEVWGLPMWLPGATDLPIGTNIAAKGDIVITSPATNAGTINLYISGEHVAVNVSTLDTVVDIAKAIVDAVNAKHDLPVTATTPAVGATTPPPATATVTLTARSNGIGGNDITVMTNYFGTIGGEFLPAGLKLTLPAGGFITGGVGVPDFATAIANLGEQQFEYVAVPYTDSNTLQDWDIEFGFTDSGRWGWRRQLFGHVFSAKRGLYDDLIAFTSTYPTPGPGSINSGVISVMGIEMSSPTPIYEWTAAYTAKAQRALTNDPARPLQTLPMTTVRLAKITERFDAVERNSLAAHGIATQQPSADHFTPMIARETTLYQLNLLSQPDDAYELVTTLATLARLLRNQRQVITSKFPRHKLADDGTRFGPGQAIVTPGVVKAELIAQYRQDEYDGLVEDTRNFKRHLLVERDPNNPNRVNVLYPPDLINQLRVFAVLAQFRLQYDRGIDTEIVAGANINFTGRLTA